MQIEDYIRDTIYSIEESIKGKKEYFGIPLYYTHWYEDPCLCGDEEAPRLHSYGIWAILPEGTPEKDYMKVNPVKVRTDDQTGEIHIMLVNILTRNANMDSVGDGNSYKEGIHLMFVRNLDSYLVPKLQDLTGIDF